MYRPDKKPVWSDDISFGRTDLILCAIHPEAILQITFKRVMGRQFFRNCLGLHILSKSSRSVFSDPWINPEIRRTIHREIKLIKKTKKRVVANFVLNLNPWEEKLKGTATLMISMIYRTELWTMNFDTSIIKNGWKLGINGHLKKSIWLKCSRHFEHLMSFQNFFNCLIFSY